MKTYCKLIANLLETTENLLETYKNLLQTYWKLLKTYKNFLETYENLLETYVEHHKERTSLHNGSHRTTEAFSLMLGIHTSHFAPK